MTRPLVLLALLIPLCSAGSVQLLTALPNNATTNVIQADAIGNIVVAGYTTSANLDTDAFIAKLTPDGSKVLYFTRIAGSGIDGISAVALLLDGSAYVAGYTTSRDFPATPGAMQTTYTTVGQTAGFVAKIDSNGVIINATLLNGISQVQITGVALASGGLVYLTGVGGPDYTSDKGAPQGFVLKLDPGLTGIMQTINGYGGGLIQLDSKDNIYLAGSAQATLATASSTLTLPTLPEPAFQTTQTAQFCVTLGTGPGGPGGSYPCRYQYVAKLDRLGNLLWATYVTGTYGAVAHGMSVDAAGNVLVAGTTYSDDYPVTAGALQTAYAPAAPTFPVPAGSTYKDPPRATGYVTKVNATGTALIWSTYFGGSFADQISGMAVGPSGDIYISGYTASKDLPGLIGVPDGCRPTATQELGFVAHLSSDGTTAAATQLITGAPHCSYFGCPITSDYPSYLTPWPVLVQAGGTLATGGPGGAVAIVNPAGNTRLACITDPADNVQLRSVTPGQFISLFGTDLAPATPFQSSTGLAPSTSNLGVSFDGVASPILYSSAQQVNVQVPFELAGKSSVQMQIVSNQVVLPISETRALGVVDRQPAVFLTPAAWDSPFPSYSSCGGVLSFGEAAVAINSDGSANSCTNPARVGSTVKLFVNGLGQTTPASSTGVVVQPPATRITPTVDIAGPTSSPATSKTTNTPGSPSGMTLVQVVVPPLLVTGDSGPIFLSPSVVGQSARERGVLIWARQ